MTTETLTVPAVTPLEPTTPIKPSEALRLGRLIRPLRVSGHPFEGDDRACALGAIHIGWGGSPDDATLNDRGWVVSNDAWRRCADRVSGMAGVKSSTLDIGRDIFDATENAGGDGDAAVLAFLEERGL